MRCCIFCQAEMSVWEILRPENGINFYAGSDVDIYQCKPCHSQQDFNPYTDKLIYYNFRVQNSKYGVCFYPKPQFALIKDYSDQINGEEVILRFDFLPIDLTPQNTTEERIKKLLVFS